jgi:DNA-directed RNA polymerase specialized sigma subunit
VLQSVPSAASCVVGLSRWFNDKERGSFYGFWSASHNIGEALTFIIVASIVSAFGWRYGFWGAGIVGIVGALMIWKFFQEVKKLTSKADPQFSNIRPSKLKKSQKFYNGDTNKFEPIPENREHLIHTLLPLVMSIAQERSKTFYTARIEFDDCIDAGMEGAIIATDLYIKKAETQVHTAKLSTFAHFYIMKYINKYIYASTSILSHGTTKGGEALACTVLSGNKTNEDTDNGRGEFFETSNDEALMSTQAMVVDNKSIDDLSEMMFGQITKHEKIAIFMFFGIGSERKYEIREIATYLKTSAFNIEKMINDAIQKLRNVFSNDENKTDMFELFMNNDLTASVHWNM